MFFNLILFFLLIISLKILYDLIRGKPIFFPLPKNTIRKVFKEVGISENDIVLDLGSGDGRVLIIAVKEFKCKKAYGIETNYFLYLISKLLVKLNKLEDKIEIIHGDFLKINWPKANVITMYLLWGIMKDVEKKLLKEVNKAKVISFAHKLPNLKENKRIKTGHFYTYVYFLN
ncbi:MAG: rRNA adenine N-6-methyltransferase family protein [Candidatus Aenigmatarchaeota archaeon]